jgi:general L-amino acid transport system substrate-binding protein
MDAGDLGGAFRDEGNMLTYAANLTFVATICLALGTTGANSQPTTLDRIKERGFLECGVNAGLTGFSAPDDKGNWKGFDVDYCKALAVAVFADVNKVKYVPTTARGRFETLRSGAIDVLIRNTTWTGERDSAAGLSFTGVTYYDGQGLIVKASRGVKSAKELDGATVCVGSETTTEMNLENYFKMEKMTYKPLAFEKQDEAVQAYLAGRCNAYTTDLSGLYSVRVQLARPREHVILPEIISKEPLGPAVRQGDAQWFTIVKWVHFVLLNAEELGVTQANLDEMLSSADQSIKLLLGRQGDFGNGLGLDNNFVPRIILAVGNYGEIFETNVGSGSRLKIVRGLNNLWNKGGLQYAPPIR